MLDNIGTFFERFLALFSEAGIFVLFGLAMAGLLHVFVPETLLLRFLGKGKYGPVFKASLIGLPLPLCSCGVLPAAIGFRRQGACKGATVAFLISTPETSVDSIAISFALLNPIMAIFRPIAAFITALLSGFACNMISTDETAKSKRKAHIPACCAVHGMAADAPISNRLRHGARFAFVEMVSDLGWWLLMGVGIAALIMTIFPTDYLSQIPGGRPVMMLAMLVVGIPLYMCSTASTPIAAGLIAAGVSPGAALVLLLVGPATNAASITVVARELGKKTTAIYLASLAAISLLMGLALDSVYDWFVDEPASQSVRAGREALPEWLMIGGAAVFGALLAGNLVMRLFGAKTCACCSDDDHEHDDDCDHDDHNHCHDEHCNHDH